MKLKLNVLDAVGFGDLLNNGERSAFTLPRKFLKEKNLILNNFQLGAHSEVC